MSNDEQIETTYEQEPIKLALKRKSERENSEYYVASKDQDQENLDNTENDSEQPSLKMTQKKRSGENSDDYYISGYTLEMNNHLKALEESGNEDEQNEIELENVNAYDRQQMAEIGHYMHIDQLKDKLDYYPVGSFPEEKFTALQLEDPMGV